MADGPTSAQLRADIDSGRTGDKAPGHDPAAAPLGTDEEAAGTPPSTEEIQQAREYEAGRRSVDSPNSADPSRTPNGGSHRSGVAHLLWLGSLAAVTAMGILIVTGGIG